MAKLVVDANQMNAGMLKFNVIGHRARWWWVVAADCGSAAGVQIDSYDLQFSNYGTLLSQVSWDQQGILWSNGLSLIIFVGLISVSILMYRKLKLMCLRTEVMVCIAAILSSHVVALAFAFVANVVFASNGRGLPLMDSVSQVLVQFTQVMFLVLLLMLSHGWGSFYLLNGLYPFAPFLIVTLLVGCASVGSVIYAICVQDPASTLYL